MPTRLTFLLNRTVLHTIRQATGYSLLFRVQIEWDGVTGAFQRAAYGPEIQYFARDSFVFQAEPFIKAISEIKNLFNQHN